MDTCYLLTTSKTVAKHIIKYYKLKKIMTEHKFEIFAGYYDAEYSVRKITNIRILLILSSNDIYSVSTCTGYLFAKFPPQDNSFFLNIDLLTQYNQNVFNKPVLCNKIHDQITLQDYYTDILYTHDFREEAFICMNVLNDVSKPCCSVIYDLTAAAAIKAASYFLSLDRIFIVRISDNDQVCSEKSEEESKSLYSKIQNILKWFNTIAASGQNQEFSKQKQHKKDIDNIKNYIKLFEEIVANLKFSENMQQQIMRIFTYKVLTDIEICASIIDEYKNKKSISKQEAKEYFEHIKYRLMD